MKKGNLMKEIIATLLVISLALSALTGCSGKNGSGTRANVAKDYYNTEGFPIVKDPITIKVAGIRGVTQNWKDTFTVKKIEENMGIKMDITTYFDSSSWDTKFVGMLTNQTLPDLMVNMSSTKDEINKYGDEGYILNFADYLDLMPNLKKYLDENPDYAMNVYTPDDKLYSLTTTKQRSEGTALLYVSKEDQKKYGFKASDIVTVDDLYNVLKKIKQQDPDVVPMSFTFDYESGQRGSFPIRTAFGIPSVNGSFCSYEKDGKLIYGDVEDNYKEFLKYMNKLYEEGLLDNEAFIMTTNELQTKIRSGKCVFWSDWTRLQVATGEDRDVWSKYDIIPSLTSKYNSKRQTVLPDRNGSAANLYVNADTPYPEAICRLVDYMFSEEGQIFFKYGIEGETFDWSKDKYGAKIPDCSKYWDDRNYNSVDVWLVQAVQTSSAFRLRDYNLAYDILEKATDEQLEYYINDEPTGMFAADAFYEYYLRKTGTEELQSLPALKYTKEESEVYQTYYTDCSQLLLQYKGQFISGKKNIDSSWSKYLKDVNSFLDKMRKTNQAALERTLKIINK